MAAVGARDGAERAVHGTAQLVHEQPVHQPPVGELGLPQGQPHPVHGVVGEPPGLGERRPGGGERVPGAGRGVGRPVLHGVQEVGEPAEEPPGLGERHGVVRPPGEVRGVREGGGGRGLGRLGDGEQGRSGPRERLDAALPVHRVDQYGGVEADGAAAARPGRVPAGGDPAGGERHRSAGQQAVPVGDVVAHLGRGQHQGDGRREAGALAVRDGRGAHSAQRAGPGGAPPGARTAPLGLSLSQNRYEQPVIVRHDSRELSVVLAQCEAQPAQMSHPLAREALSEPVPARPDDSEHDAPPWLVRR